MEHVFVSFYSTWIVTSKYFDTSFVSNSSHLFFNDCISSLNFLILLIFGSIGCALAKKFGGEAKAHKISKTQKPFGEIPPE